MKRVVLNYLVIIAMIVSAALTSCNEHDDKSKEFIVTFETGDGGNTVAPQKVNEGEKVTKPEETPTRSKYAFVAWYKEAEWRHEWNFDTDEVTADVTLYAKWIADDNDERVEIDNDEGVVVDNDDEIEDNNETSTISIRDKFLVDKIYDYHDNLLAEYIYDDDNKITKRIITVLSIFPLPPTPPIRTTETFSEDKFEYENGRVSKIINDTWQLDTYHETGNKSRHDYHSEIIFEYDLQGRVTKTNRQDCNFRYENGRIISIGPNIEPYTNTIVYDNSGNIIKSISIVPELGRTGQPIPGTTREVVDKFEYDNNPKPNFGLDYLIVFEPLPNMGTETGYVRTISHNNLTKYVNSGTTWTFTYNENGLPETIETKWGNIETLEPMLMRITYKQIE